MIFNRLVWAIVALLPLGSKLFAASPTCAPLTKERMAFLCRYVQRKYKLSDNVQLTISSVSDVGDTCYRKLRFESTQTARHFDLSLYLTADQRFLVPELNDSHVDPVLEEKRRLAALRQTLEMTDGAQPPGSAAAPVTIVVFSDFQCPYCKRLADTLKEISLDQQTAHQVRVVFRNMPLDIHSWAQVAAEMAACVQLQDPAAFWNIHDYLFGHQGELTPENIRPRLSGLIASMPTVSAEQANECINNRLSLLRIQKDLSIAKLNNVRATPTFFVNGVRVEGAATKEHLLTLIREALEAARSGTGTGIM